LVVYVVVLYVIALL